MAELLQDSGGVSGICQRTMLRPLEIDLHRPQRTGEIHGTGEPVEPLVDPLEIHPVGIEHFVQRLLFQIRLFQQNALVWIAPGVEPAAHAVPHRESRHRCAIGRRILHRFLRDPGDASDVRRNAAVLGLHIGLKFLHYLIVFI